MTMVSLWLNAPMVTLLQKNDKMGFSKYLINATKNIGGILTTIFLSMHVLWMLMLGGFSSMDYFINSSVQIKFYNMGTFTLIGVIFIVALYMKITDKNKNHDIAFGSNVDEILSERFEEHVNKLENYQYLTEEQKKLYKNDFYQKHSVLMNGKTTYSIETQKEMIEIQEILDDKNPSLLNKEIK